MLKKEKVSQCVVAKNFEAAAAEWLAYMQPFLKESSYIKYRSMLEKYILPGFRWRELSEIDYSAVETFCRDMLSSGGKKHYGLSRKTAADVLSVIKSVMKFAARRKYTQELSALDVSIKQDHRQIRTFNAAEEDRLIDFLMKDENPLSTGILLCIFTGIRIGEVCALTWGDVSLDEGIICIRRTLQRLQTTDGLPKTKIIITAPKSRCSVREIPIPGVLRPRLSVSFRDEAYVLTGCVDRYVEPRTLQNHFKRVLLACCIDNANFHILRHTFATRCVEAGFDLKSLSEILGHSGVGVTLNRYVHPSMEQKRKNMEKLARVLSANIKTAAGK